MLRATVGFLVCLTAGLSTAGGAPPRSERQITPAAVQPELPDPSLPYARARFDAWAEVKRLVATFETASMPSAPGLNHLAADVRAIQRRIEAGGRIELDRLDPESLVTRNRHFWRAMLETARGDVLVPIFEAMVWLSAGQVVRAQNQIRLLRSTPHVPEHLDHMLLRHLQNIDQSAPAALTEDLSFASTSPPGSGRLSRLEHVATRHPGDPTIAHHILLNRLLARGVPTDPEAMTDDGAELAGLATVVRESVAEVAVLRKQNPVFAALFQSDPDRRRRARDLWSTWGEALRPDGAINDEDLGQIVAGVEQLGLPDRALALSRLITAGPALDPAEDQARWQRLLPHVIGEEESAPILRDADRRQAPLIAFTTHDSRPPHGTPARPIHPLIAHKAERLLRETTFTIEHGTGEPEELANAYRRRAYALKELGRWEEADADLRRLTSADTLPEMRANLRTYLALERNQPRDAWRAVESLRRHSGNSSTVFMLTAAAHAREGKWAKAAEAYAAVTQMSAEDAERRAYAAFHAAAAFRFAGGEARALIDDARRRSPRHAWVTSLLDALLDDAAARQLLDDADQGAAVQRLDRRCEAYLALAIRPGVTPEEMKAALIACVDTGRTGFIEYDLARTRLEQIAPDWWSEPR